MESSLEFRERKLSEMKAYKAELEALASPVEVHSIDILQIPPGTLCVVNALAGEVWMSQGVPQRRWLWVVEEDVSAGAE